LHGAFYKSQVKSQKSEEAVLTFYFVQ